MKFLRQILLIGMLVIGFSLTASAQRQPDEKKRPPKEKNEIRPETKKPPKNNDNRNNNRGNDNRGKKPQTYFLISENQIVVSSK